MRRVIFAAFLLLVVAPPMSADVPVSSVEFGSPGTSSSVAAVASSNDVALIVWNETRSIALGSTRTRVVAARIDASGKVLDRIPFPLSTGEEGYATAAAWTGSVFLVAWNNPRTSHLTVVNGDGRIVTTTELGASGRAAISCNPGGCLVTLAGGLPWALTLDMIVTDTAGAVRVSRQTIAQLAGTVTANLSATDGSSFLAAWSTWESRDTVRWAVIGADGRVHRELAGPVGARPAGVGSDGTGYVVAFWQGNSLLWQPLDSDGNEAGRSVRPDTGSATSWSDLTIVPSGGNFVVVGGQIAVALTESGTPVATPLATAGLVTLAAASMDGRALVISSNSSTGALLARMLGSDARPTGEAFPVEIAARTQSSPSAVLSGNRLLTVWSERVDGRLQVRMSILRDAVTRELEQWVAPSDASQSAPSVAFNGSEYLVAWTESGPGSGRVMVRRFTLTGLPLDGSAVALAAEASPMGHAFAASDGRDFLVVWSEVTAGETYVVGRRWTSAGAGGKVAITSAQGQIRANGIAWDGSRYVVLWSVARLLPILCDPVGCWEAELRTTIVSQAGEVADQAEVQIATGVSLDPPAHAVATADGTLVVWLGKGISGRLLRHDGTLAEPRLLASTNWDYVFGSSVTRVGSQLFLAWSTFGKVSGAFVSPDGSSAGQPVMLAETGANGDRPAIVDLGGGSIGVVYQRFTDDEVHGRASRLFVRTVTVAAPRQRSIRR